MIRRASARLGNLLVLACMLAGAGPAASQSPAAATAAGPAASAPSAACPAAAAITQQHMLGLWRAEFEGLWQGATLLIEKHPRYSESFAGAINRNGERGQLAGDIENGELTLEESADGVRISATWVGDVVEGSCGREIRGTWKAEGEGPARAFVLRKQAS